MSEFRFPINIVGEFPSRQLLMAFSTLALVGISSLSYWLECSPKTQEVQPMKRILIVISCITKALLTVSVNIGVNLLTSNCQGS